VEVTKNIPPKFDGSVKVKVPKHVDRIKLIRSLNTTVDVSGELVKTGMDSAEKLMDFAKSHIETVSLKRIEDGVEVKNVEWLEYDVDGAEVLSEISNVLLQGVKLGKS
jgi:hypothetical protein